MNITKEMIDYFYTRTKYHIQLVIDNATKLYTIDGNKYQGLMIQTKFHDQSKYSSKERIPYIVLTYQKYCEANNIPFEVDEKIKNQIKNATFHHIKNNRHHPAFHDLKYKKTSTIANGEDMLDLDLYEMVCDWFAMSQELGNDVEEYAKEVVGTKYLFSKRQEKLIYETISNLKGESK